MLGDVSDQRVVLCDDSICSIFSTRRTSIFRTRIFSIRSLSESVSQRDILTHGKLVSVSLCFSCASKVWPTGLAEMVLRES
jgi:hypothetical protein